MQINGFLVNFTEDLTLDDDASVVHTQNKKLALTSLAQSKKCHVLPVNFDIAKLPLVTKCFDQVLSLIKVQY